MDLESEQNALYLQISQLEEIREVKNCLRNMVCSYADLCRGDVVDIAGNHAWAARRVKQFIKSTVVTVKQVFPLAPTTAGRGMAVYLKHLMTSRIDEMGVPK